MGNLPDSARYRRNEDFVARKIAGETVLVPIRQQLGDLESIYTLNEVATFIWERLTEEPTVAGLAAATEETFAEEPAIIRRDLEELLEQLLSLGAVRPVDVPPDGRESMPQP